MFYFSNYGLILNFILILEDGLDFNFDSDLMLVLLQLCFERTLVALEFVSCIF